MSGVVRDGIEVPAGVKLFEIDPHGRRATWSGIDPRYWSHRDSRHQGDRASRRRRLGADGERSSTCEMTGDMRHDHRHACRGKRAIAPQRTRGGAA
jgi:hypothetical protein